MDGGSFDDHLGNLWNNSSETYGINGEISLRAVSRQVYKTVLAVRIAPTKTNIAPKAVERLGKNEPLSRD